MNIKSFFNWQTKTVFSSAVILGVSGIASRFFGLIRDWLLSSTFGAGSQLDVYYVAFRVPDMIYRVLIAGGIIVAFLPLFSEYYSKDKEKAWRFTNNLLNIFLLLLVVVSFILFLFSPLLIKIIAPGFDAEQSSLAILLTRILFISPILFGLSSIFSGVLHYFNRFLIYAICPILYNIGIILGIVFLVPKFGILGVAFGVVFGALLYLLIQIPSAISCGFKYKKILDFKDGSISRVFHLILPRIIATAGQQINLVVITAIASTLGSGSISIFNFANNFQYFPIGVVGVSFATAVFPKLSKNWIEDNREEFVQSFLSVFSKILYFIIPFSVLIFILRVEIIEIILKHGQFTQDQAILTASCLGLFCLGIWAITLIPLMFRAFFSMQDTKTPTIITILSVCLNVALSLFLTSGSKLVDPLYVFIRNQLRIEYTGSILVLGLALAFSLVAVFQLILLIIFLKRRIVKMPLKIIFDSLWKIITSSLIMVLFVDYVYNLTEFIVGFSVFWQNFFQIAIVMIFGALIYLISTWFLKISEARNLISNFFKILK